MTRKIVAYSGALEGVMVCDPGGQLRLGDAAIPDITHAGVHGPRFGAGICPISEATVESQIQSVSLIEDYFGSRRLCYKR